jgi:hypothetical protein
LTFLNSDPVVAAFDEDNGAEITVTRFRNGAWEAPSRYGSPDVEHMTLIANGNTLLIGSADFDFGQGVARVTRVAFPP